MAHATNIITGIEAASSAACIDGLDPWLAFPQIGVGVNIIRTTNLLTSALGTDSTSRMLFSSGALSSPKSCYEQYTTTDAANDYKLLEGSDSVAAQMMLDASVTGSGWGASIKASGSYTSTFERSSNITVLQTDVAALRCQVGRESVDGAIYILKGIVRAPQ